MPKYLFVNCTPIWQFCLLCFLPGERSTSKTFMSNFSQKGKFGVSIHLVMNHVPKPKTLFSPLTYYRPTYFFHMLLYECLSNCNLLKKTDCVPFTTHVKMCYAFPLKPQIVPRICTKHAEMIYTHCKLFTNGDVLQTDWQQTISTWAVVCLRAELLNWKAVELRYITQKIQTHSEGPKSFLILKVTKRSIHMTFPKQSAHLCYGSPFKPGNRISVIYVPSKAKCPH